MDFLHTILHYSLTIIPAFLLALLVSAVIVEFLPDKLYERILSSNNFLLIVAASVLGALIPICTCGMIPLASKLHKKGASWLFVISFLTAGNASSITALLLTLILGIGITLFRFVFAVIFGILVAYIFVLLFKPKSLLKEDCSTDLKQGSPVKRITSEFVSLSKSFGPWVLMAVLIASVISLYLHPVYVVNFAGVKNFFAPFLFSVIGFPFYFCAGADIPISSALVHKHAGLGSIFSFMTTAGGVNLTSLLVYQKWIGLKSSIIYLLISVIVSGCLGLIVNFAFLPLAPIDSSLNQNF